MTDKAKNLVDAAKATATIFTRQLGIFNPHENKLTMSIVGVGAVGSVVALAAAKLGVREIEIWDMDTVEEANLPIQMHQKSAIGKNKALASKELIEAMMPEVEVIAHPEKWVDQDLKADIVVSGADSLPVRKAVWDAVKYDPSVQLLCDARIGGQLMKLYYVDPDGTEDIKLYDGTFPKKDMKGSELPCTERGVIDVSFFAAALHIRAIRRWVVKREKETYRVVDLSGEFPNIIC